MASSRIYCNVEKCMKWANLDENQTCPYHAELQRRDKGLVKFTCGACSNDVLDTEKSLLCECCNCWFHATCEGVDNATYDILFEKGSKLHRLKFFCSGCDNKVVEALEKFSMLETETKTLKHEMNEVKTDIAEIKQLCRAVAKKGVNAVLDDSKEIEKRKMNLIVYGLPECQDSAENDQSKWDTPQKIAADTEKMNNLIMDDLNIPLSPRTGIIEVRRLGLKRKDGSDRPLKVVFAN